MGKVEAGAKKGERYLSVYLRVPPAPIARRSEPVAGRVATRSGCPLFCCQEGAKRAHGVGGRKGTGQAGSPPRMGGGVERRERRAGPALEPQFPTEKGQHQTSPFSGIHSFVHQFIHSFIYSFSNLHEEGQVIQRWQGVYLPHEVLTEALSFPSSLPLLPVAPE